MEDTIEDTTFVEDTLNAVKPIKPTIEDKPPRVMIQQRLICKACLFNADSHMLVAMHKNKNNVWEPDFPTRFHASDVCSLCYDLMETTGETTILWPQLFDAEVRQQRQQRLRGGFRGSPFILGENKEWIYWSDGLQMAQHTMVKPRQSEEWWRRYYEQKSLIVQKRDIVLC